MPKSASTNSAKRGARAAAALASSNAQSHTSSETTVETALSSDAREALQTFESALRARGASETTRRYLAACKTLAAARGNEALYETQWRDAQRCLASLHARGIAPRTLATTLSAWKSWFRLLARHDARYKPDAFDAVRVPKPPKRLPGALTEIEMTQLLDAKPTDEAEGDWHERDVAMLELLYGCGLRVSELTGLDLADIDLAAREIRVYGKGRKERLSPLGTKAFEALGAWLPVRATRLAAGTGDTETAVFIGARGGRIATTVVRRVLAAIASERGISSHVHPHRLRHSFASHVLQGSRDLRAVQELMGHASIASTQVYTHLDFQHLASVYDQAHPRARKAKKS
jgi:integrase/recombinase XerC